MIGFILFFSVWVSNILILNHIIYEDFDKESDKDFDKDFDKESDNGK